MSVFTHVVVGTNDLAKSRRFYDATLSKLGLNYLGMMGDHGHLYGTDKPAFLTTRPRDGKPACFANGALPRPVIMMTGMARSLVFSSRSSPTPPRPGI